MSVRVTLYLRVHVEPTLGRPRVYRRTVDYLGVPRVGDRVEFTDGGWSKQVQDVWWHRDGTVSLEFRDYVTDLAGEETTALTNRPGARLGYIAEDELPALLEAGWELEG